MILISSFLQFKLIFAFIIQVVLVHSITNTVTFNYNGGGQTWPVPFNVHSIHLTVRGASSGSGTAGTPGRGAMVVCDLAVTMGTTINIYVGGVGGNAHSSNTNDAIAGGYNGGGQGCGSGTGGGGASDIRIGGTAYGNRKVVAGGGGGIYAAGNCGVQPIGGNGGEVGHAGSNGCSTGIAGGGGGTATGGGSAGAGGATGGSLGTGGRGDYGNDNDAGGGGGGYYGG
jgi:hypothetical protein